MIRRLLRMLFGVALVVLGYFGLKQYGIDLKQYIPSQQSISNVTEQIESLVDPAQTESSAVTFSKEQLERAEGHQVQYVTDGDTFHISVDGQDVLVRLVGVDTPESVNPDETKNTPEGKIASEYTKSLLTGKTVWLECDQEHTDKYGRALAYVYLDSNKTMMLQEYLLEDGMAQCMPIRPNTKYQNRFAEIESQARQECVGFWETDFWLD